MILILSGRYQGARAFTKRQFPGKSVFSKNVSELADDFLCSEISGDIDSSAEAIASHAFTAGKDIIFCHIIGCGVVPVDKKQRYLAELVGRTSCILAKQADEVWLVRAGIGTRLK